MLLSFNFLSDIWHVDPNDTEESAASIFKELIYLKTVVAGLLETLVPISEIVLPRVCVK
jgi:hypothetical protein